MALNSLSEDDFKKILSENFTPSATIKTPERLLGRDRALRTIDRAFASEGRQVFIYGDRGVGKTSLAQTAANLHHSAGSEPIYVVCSEGSQFGEIISAVGNSIVSVSKRIEQGGEQGSYGGSLFGNGLSFKKGKDGVPDFSNANTLNGALDVIRYILDKRDGQQIIIIDEMERITSSKEKEKFAEFIKNIPELDSRIKFIFCGIGTTIDSLIGAHPSAGRILEPINLEKLHHNYLWDIVRNVADKADIAIGEEMLVRIGQISDGFPHYVHLIGKSMFWSAFDDVEVVNRFSAQHFKQGIEGALNRAEAMLRQQYQRATMKTKNTADYEEALWSLADTTSDQRQLSEIYEFLIEE